MRQARRRPDYERWLATVPFPADKTAFQTLATDAQQRLWVRTWEETDNGTNRWLVFEPAGAMVAEVAVAADVTLLDIGEEYVLALWHDELDVEYVQAYELFR